MSEITDRELLAFCDLMNLPIEFSDVIDEINEEKETIKHHTVASLIENDIIELKRRGEILKKAIVEVDSLPLLLSPQEVTKKSKAFFPLS